MDYRDKMEEKMWHFWRIIVEIWRVIVDNYMFFEWLMNDDYDEVMMSY